MYIFYNVHTYIILYYRCAMMCVPLLWVSDFITWEIIMLHPNRIVSALSL